LQGRRALPRKGRRTNSDRRRHTGGLKEHCSGA
jgi:hypothetical protein